MIELTLRRVGNSVGVILPRGTLDHLHLDIGHVTVASLTESGLLISRMKTLDTLGKGKKSESFRYTGSAQDGVILLHKTGPRAISAELFERALRELSERELPGGFDKVSPPSNGFGAWLQRASNGQRTPQDASHMAAILKEEAGVSVSYKGTAVILKFPKA